MGRFRLAAPSAGIGLFGLVFWLLLLAACRPASETPGEVAGDPVSPPPVVDVAQVQDEPQVDPVSGLIIDEGWELVRGSCAACHSAKLVTQNRGSRDTWASMIRWMQQTQGLWPLDPATENTILDYLARNYAPSASFRRAPLPGELMPANPYAGKASS